MRKWKILVIPLLLLCLCSCGETSNYTPPEQPHLYWKTVTAVVTDNDVRRWFAGTHHARATTTVYNEEYDLEATLTAQGSGMFGAPWEINLQKGDKVEVELYSWVYDSTGEVIKREIHRIERRAEE